MSLNKQQKQTVKDMGFGKLLSMVVNGIPSKIAYFVVDKFDPETMEIKFGRIAIKVDEESIHKLLGLPNKGIDLTTIEVPKKMTQLANSFKKRYRDKPFSTTHILNRINTEGDDCGLMFKLDFIVLFVTSMVECHLNGWCKTSIVELLNEEMNFGDINWCKYIVSVIKKMQEWMGS